MYNGEPEVFDLISLFDVIEHIPNPDIFLKNAAQRTKLALIKTPMETSGDWFGAKPPKNQGEEHEDGHLNFFSPKEYEKLLTQSGFDIIAKKSLKSIVPPGKSQMILHPESYLKRKSFQEKNFLFAYQITPYFITRRLFGGGDHISLVSSHYNY